MAHVLTARSGFLHEFRGVLAASVLLHLILLLPLVLGLGWLSRPPPPPVRLAIQATVVDERAAHERAAEAQRREAQARAAEQRQRQREIEQREAQAQASERQRAEQERLQAQQRQAEVQARAESEAKAKAAEAARVEARAQAEAKARAAAQARAKAEAEAKAQSAAQAKAEAAAAAEARARADAERRRADLARQLAEEEDLNAIAGSAAAAQYRELIRQKVRRNWSEPASARPGDSCEVRVQQIPGGEVISAVALNCTGDAAFARSVETAVLRASPLPLPADPRLFERNVIFTFKPEQ